MNGGHERWRFEGIRDAGILGRFYLWRCDDGRRYGWDVQNYRHMTIVRTTQEQTDEA